MRRIIDGHTHAFPAEVCRDRDKYCLRDGWFQHLYENPRARLTGENELLESMDTVGVERSIIAGFPWSDPGLCREHNAWMAEVCREHPDRFSFLAIVSPEDERAAQDLADAFELGALGLGELNADAQSFQVENPASTAAVVEVCAGAGKPIMFHTSEPVGHVYPGKGTATPDKLLVWLEAYPDQPVIFAHWGGGLPFYELNKAVRRLTSNVVYDCAATTYLYDFRVFPTVLGIVGQERVIFGSDFPVLGQDRLLQRVQTVVDEDQLEDLLSANAQRTFKLADEGAA